MVATLEQLDQYDFDITKSIKEIQSLAVSVLDIPHLKLTEQEQSLKSDLMQPTMRLFKKGLKQNINDKHKKSIEDMLHILVKGQYHEYIFPLAMGGGKTLGFGQYVISMSRLDSNFGAIICLERKEDVRKYASSINKTLGRVVAYPMYGYEADECVSNIVDDCKFTRCHYNANPSFNRCTDSVRDYDCRYFKQKFEYKSYPILVMTHQRLYMDADVFAEKYKYFDVQGKLLPRTRLFIDEKPFLVKKYQISSENFHGIMENIRKRLRGYKVNKGLIGELNNSIRIVTGMLEPSDVKKEEIKAVKPGFSFSPEFWGLIRFTFNIDDKWFQALEATEKIIGNSCIKETNQTNITVLLSLCLYKEYKDNIQFCTVIFDGTADLDKTYRHQNYNLIKLEPIRTYENLEFYLFDQLSSSRTSFKKIVESFCQEVKAIADKHPDEKIYVPVYSEYEKEIKSHLSDYIAKKQISIAHFGATKGSNIFKECSIIILGGILHKTEAYYLSLAKAINGQVSSLGICFDSNRNRRFSDRDVEMIKLHDMVVDYSQEIARTRQRDNTMNVKGKVFIFTKDRAFLESIRIKFPGSQAKEWTPINIIEDRIKSRTNNEKQQMLLEILKTVSTSISYSELRKKLDMSPSGFSHLLTDNKNLLEKYGFREDKVGRNKYLIKNT